MAPVWVFFSLVFGENQSNSGVERGNSRRYLTTYGLACFPCSFVRYVGLCINMALGIALNKTAYYIALLWTGSMTSYFMV